MRHENLEITSGKIEENFHGHFKIVKGKKNNLVPLMEKEFSHN